MVAERQARELGLVAPSRQGLTDSRYLNVLLSFLFGGRKIELHHRPALVNRRRYIRNGKTLYDPPANSTEHLFYLLDDEHDIETRIRGQGAQLSDLAIARKRKRKARKAKRPKHKWPSRPMQSKSSFQKRRKP